MTDPRGARARIGSQAGNYRLLELIGEGGMGAVYRAENPRIGRQVAIKLLAARVSFEPGMRERFEAEARAVTRIGHPGIIEIFDFGETEDGQLYYVMELLQGRELADVLKERGSLPAAEVLPFLEQIAPALAAAHDAGVVHRDLKPENIFVLDGDTSLGEPLRVKLLDFGVAKLLDPGSASHTSTGMVLGTPFTIAPEQAAADSASIGPHTDLYSLGVVLYWLLAGRPPFCNLPTAVILAKHITEAPPPLAEVAPTIPAPVASLVECCLEKDPELRPPSALALLADYRAALSACGRAIPPTMLVDAVQRATVQRDAGSGGGDTAPDRDVNPTAATIAQRPPGHGAPGDGSGERTTDPATALVGPPRSGPPALLVAVVGALLLVGGGLTSYLLLRGAPPPPASGSSLATRPSPTDASPGLAPDKAEVGTTPGSAPGEGGSTSSPPAKATSVSYTARLSAADHRNRRGARLRSAAAVVRQDRANVHRYGLRDPDDQGDPLFAGREARRWLGERLRRSPPPPSVRAAILRGTPRVRVSVDGAVGSSEGRVTITLLP